MIKIVFIRNSHTSGNSHTAGNSHTSGINCRVEEYLDKRVLVYNYSAFVC